MNQPTTPETGIDWADAWEHPPEHGPAVFVAERRALDTTGMHGAAAQAALGGDR